MKFTQAWTGHRIVNGKRVDSFPATVPGNIQKDFASFRGMLDPAYSDNYKWFADYENDAWDYEAVLNYKAEAGETVWFVSHGIDYKYDVLLNGAVLYSYEGAYAPFELDLTPLLRGQDVLTVHVYPHPKVSVGTRPNTRDEACCSCKPPVCYGWDFQPRLLISGMWQEAYIETRNACYISRPETTYTLANDLSSAKVHIDFKCETLCTVTLFDKEGNVVYEGTDTDFTVENPTLWWCNGAGEAYLYRYVVKNENAEVEGRIGFKRVHLLRNKGADDPFGFPKSRYDAPFTLELNGKKIFMKGANWVNPELFWGDITRNTYSDLLTLAVDAHMNILRVWGGASLCKRDFYELCDELGILVWQEFMLACNAYPNTNEYLAVLESEATAMIHDLRSHPSLTFWCGGNELFNGWSGMTDQSLALRLLGKLCYDLDRDRPFLMTSPLVGMAHGGYRFYDPNRFGGDIMGSFQRSSNTAYTEFGVPSFAPMELLRTIIPEDEIDKCDRSPGWCAHHAFDPLVIKDKSDLDTIEMFFGKPKTTEDIVEASNIFHCEGLKGIFEEARRQWPHCSAAITWCLNEPWLTAVNGSLVNHPAHPKPAYYATKQSLRPTLFSARFPKFNWATGEDFYADIWLLNDSFKEVGGKVTVTLTIGDETFTLLKDAEAVAKPNANTQMARVYCHLPYITAKRMTLRLESEDGTLSSEYTLVYKPKKAAPPSRIMNL